MTGASVEFKKREKLSFMRLGQGPRGTGVRTWLPKLESPENWIGQMEGLWWKAATKRADFVNGEWFKTHARMVELGSAHAESERADDGKPSWILYEASGNCVSAKWLKEAPEKPLNAEAGRERRKAELRLDDLSRRAELIKEVLNLSMEKFVNSKNSKGELNCQLAKVSVNGRGHWWLACKNRRGIARFKKIAEPDPREGPTVVELIP
jgi:hypothetical protein